MKSIAIVGSSRCGTNHLRSILHENLQGTHPDYRGPLWEPFDDNDFAVVLDDDGHPIAQTIGELDDDSPARHAAMLSASPYWYAFSAHCYHLKLCPEALAYVTERCRIVLLNRRDRRAQFVSFLRARMSGVWTVEEARFGTASPPTPAEIDAAYAVFLSRYRHQQMMTKALAPLAEMSIDYEDVVADPFGIASQIIGFPATKPGTIVRMPNDVSLWMDPAILDAYFSETGEPLPVVEPFENYRRKRSRWW